MSDTTDSGPSGESITPEGLDELRAEVEGLEGPARKEMAARIKVARELGDLKENADYHIAKEDQAHLETRIKRLRMRLRDAVVVEPERGGDAFAFGRHGQVVDCGPGPDAHLDAWSARPRRTWRPGGSRPSSPVGQALRDKPVGEDVLVETPARREDLPGRAPRRPTDSLPEFE